MMRRLLLVEIGLFLLLTGAATRHCFPQEKLPGNVQQALQKEEITLLITDSGLGGLSVCGSIEKGLEHAGAYKNVKLIFCNALPEANYGYNTIESEEKKASVFSDALSGMAALYKPDVILIACNTLSVVYPETKFSKTSSTPVLGIVELGAKMLYEKMNNDTASTLILFGTETTIEANSHKNLLTGMGIASERIVPQACMELAGEIQSNPASDMVLNMVDMYVSDAVSRLPESRSPNVYAGLCCTHYGYSASTFIEAFRNAGVSNVEIVNPNEAMAKVIIDGSKNNKFSGTSLSVTVVSRAPLSKEEIASISALLEHDSPKTATALKQYEHNKNLFPFVKE